MCLPCSNAGYFLPRFEEGALGPEEMAQMMTSLTIGRIAKFVVSLNEEQVAAYEHACKSQGLRVCVVRMGQKPADTMAKMVETYLDGVIKFAVPPEAENDGNDAADGGSAGAVAHPGKIVTHKEVADKLAAKLEGKSSLVHVLAANFVRILQQFFPERVVGVLDAPPTDVQAALNCILDATAEAYPKHSQ